MVFHDSDGRILELIHRMQEELLEQKAGYTEILRCYLIQLLLLTLRQLDDARVASAGQNISTYLAEYVRSHYMESITLRELAKKTNYSVPYLSKRFQDDLGISFVSYLQNCRVMEGCRLLSNSKHSLKEITSMVGYSDVKFFSAMIKRHTGLSPREFRKKHTF
jgi:YesN/AraC family two-component response regulator